MKITKEKCLSSFVVANTILFGMLSNLEIYVFHFYVYYLLDCSKVNAWMICYPDVIGWYIFLAANCLLFLGIYKKDTRLFWPWVMCGFFRIGYLIIRVMRAIKSTDSYSRPYSYEEITLFVLDFYLIYVTVAVVYLYNEIWKLTRHTEF